MKKRFALTRWSVVACIATAVSLSGCFGGNDDDSPPAVTSEVPATASASAAGFIAYLQALVVADADMLEPVDTSSVTPPADDTSEPAVVN